MINLLLIVQGIITLLLIGVILLQRSEGGGLLQHGGGSSGNMFTARGATNLLTRITAFLATLFFVNCLLMGGLANRQVRHTSSMLEEPVKGPSIPSVPQTVPQATVSTAAIPTIPQGHASTSTIPSQ